jgi:hypothetical protein
LREGGDEDDCDQSTEQRFAASEACAKAPRKVEEVHRQADVGMDVGEWCRLMRSTVVARRTNEVNDMSRRSYVARYTQARSFKWVIGLIFILAALYALFVNHVSLLDAAILFGIGVILV